MKIELKEFQEIAVVELMQEINFARREASGGKPQAVILSSPTGSGKTVTITALMERIIAGYESTQGDPNAVFLWLSDSPELNEQSRDKLLQTSNVFRARELEVIDGTFDRKQFAPGKIYFLNTQKLGKDKSLVTKGDNREYTIWETIRNTAEAEPSHFFVVIDEAHKGMAEGTKDREQANSIVQKFIKGSDGEIPPIKLIVGMSATPDRFLKILDNRRITRKYDIEAADVRASGLLKDTIIIRYPEETQPSDWSLLRAATEDWQRFTEEWKTYAAAQSLSPINPVLVVQVENAAAGKVTETDLEKTIETIESVSGRLAPGEMVHCFQEDTPVEVFGHKIAKADASKIQADEQIKVVLFKMSLTTGWDCPRAEVMMSFRKARDFTLIAQLVGRMVRTPLARSVENSEVLNSVSLYLPHYDKAGLKNVVEKLRSPDPEVNIGIEVKIGSEVVEYSKDADKAELFDVLSELPSYFIERTSKSTKVKRFIKLSRQLTRDKIDESAWDEAKNLVVATLKTELGRLRKTSEFKSAYDEKGEISIRALTLDYGELEAKSDTAETIKATPDNINDLFAWCGTQLGEGLHDTFWRAMTPDPKDEPLKAKIELFLVLQNEKAQKNLEDVCGKLVDALFAKYRKEISALPTSKQEKYRKIKASAKEPEPWQLTYPEIIQVTKEEPEWKGHLYVDKKGNFGAKLNEWEQKVLKEEMNRPSFLGWLRNVPRKQWALCAPYRSGGESKGMYPDFLVLRKKGTRIIVDMFEPHSTSLSDSWSKAVGLAAYADKHGDYFGLIEMITVSANGSIKRLNFCNEDVRERAKKISTNEELNVLFDSTL
jgi:type III restriction enzyme